MRACSRSRRNVGEPASASAIHSLANVPSWISSRIRRISARTSVSIDPRAARVVAVLGGVGDRVAHPRQAALVHQVDDQLQLVQALEVRDLRLVAGLDERLEPGLDQRRGAAAEHRLLAEEVGLGLFLERGLDARRRARRRCRPRRRARAPGPCPVASWCTAISAGVPMPCSYVRRTRWPGPFGAIIVTSTSSGGAIVPKWMLNPCANISMLPASRFGAMSSAYAFACAVSGRTHHHDVGLARRRRRCPGPAGRRPRRPSRDDEPGPQADADVEAGVLQVQRVRVALAAEPEDRDLLPLQGARGPRPSRSRSWPSSSSSFLVRRRD